jgi:hypothetical protein
MLKLSWNWLAHVTGKNEDWINGNWQFFYKREMRNEYNYSLLVNLTDINMQKIDFGI